MVIDPFEFIMYVKSSQHRIELKFDAWFDGDESIFRIYSFFYKTKCSKIRLIANPPILLTRGPGSYKDHNDSDIFEYKESNSYDFVKFLRNAIAAYFYSKKDEDGIKVGPVGNFVRSYYRMKKYCMRITE